MMEACMCIYTQQSNQITEKDGYDTAKVSVSHFSSPDAELLES